MCRAYSNHHLYNETELLQHKVNEEVTYVYVDSLGRQQIHIPPLRCHQRHDMKYLFF
jgi:hypothetical protein